MQIEDRGLIDDAQDRPHDERVACFASLCLTRRGTLLSAFQLGSIKNSPQSTLRLRRSYDGGQSWNEIAWRFATTFAGVNGSLSNGELVELEDGRLLLIATWIDRTDPARPFFDPVTEGILHTRILKSHSCDEGASWSDWEEIPLATAGWSYHSSGPILSREDGLIAFVAESHKSFDSDAPANAAEASWLMISADQGQTFEGPYCLCRHPEQRVFYWDARIAPGPSPDSWLALYWTHDPLNQHDLAVHWQQGTVTANEVIAGPTHSTGIDGQISAPLCLDSQHWLAVVVSRDLPGTIAVWQTRDAGTTWRESLTVYSHAERLSANRPEGGSVAEIWENIGKWGFGHPAIRWLGTNRALVTWYAGDAGGMSIHWARVDLGD